MPTIQQWVSEQRGRGASADEIKAGFKGQYGDDLDSLDANADYDAYKAAKTAAKAPKPAVALPKPAAALPPITYPAPKAAPAIGLSEEPVATTAITAREGVERDPLKSETVWSPMAAARGLLSGTAKGALGDTKLTRAIDAARVISEEIPTPVEALSQGINRLGDIMHAPVQFTRGVTGAPISQRLSRATAAVKDVPKAKEAVIDVDYAKKALAESMEGSRKERAAAGLRGGVGEGAVQALENVGVDLTNVARGIIDLGSTILAPKEVYQGVTAGDVAKQAGEEMGKAMPGQVLDLARGLLDGEQNSFATKPFTTWLMLIDPAIRVGAVTPMGKAAAAKVRAAYAETVARPAISRLVDNVLFDVPADVRTGIKRAFEDGVIQRDPRMTGMLDELLYGSQRAGDMVRNMAERAARQIEQGRVVAPAPTALKPARVSLIPETAAGEAARAARFAENQAAVAGTLGGLSDAALAAKAEAAALAKGVGSVGRAAERAEAKIATTALDELTAPPSAKPMNAQQRARAARAAQPGIDLAERAKQLDAEAAKGMTAEVSTLAGRQARQAGRQAEAAAMEATEAGIRPEVNLGEVYLPGFKQTGRGRLALGEAERGVQAPVLSLEEALPQLPEGRRAAILQAAEDASAKKAAALDALGDVDIMQVQVDRNTAAGLRNQADLYEAAREQAQRLNSRNVSDLPAVLTETIRQLVDRQAVDPKLVKVIDRAAPQIADWLYAEIVAENQAETASVPFGAIERPVPEVTRMEVGPGGRVIERPEYQQALGERNAGPELLDRESAAQVRASDELALARSVKLEPEAPKAYQTGVAEFDVPATEIADVMRESGYYPSERVPGTKVIEKPIDLTGSPAELSTFFEQSDAAIKRLSTERIGQRMMEVLESDTTQLVRNRVVRAEMLREVKRRAEAAGIPTLQKMRLIRDFNEQLIKPERTGATSKSRFVTLDYQGTPLWTREDWATVLNKIPKEKLNKVRADVLRDVADDMGKAVQARASVLQLYEEINRFRKDAQGNINVKTLGDSNSYAKEVARRVLKEGEVMPMLMPFNGQSVFDAMSTNAKMWSADLGVPEAAVLKLADKLKKYEDASKVDGLNDTFSSYYKGVFHNTSPVPDFANVAVNRGALSSLQSHFAMLQATDTLGPAPSLVREISQRMKAGAVAMNLRSLFNNNVSNAVGQAIRLGDPTIMLKMPDRLRTWKSVYDGNTAGMDPATVLKYKSLQNENIINGNQLNRDIGKSRLMETLEKGSPGKAQALRAIGTAVETGPAPVRLAGKAVELIPRAQDALARLYTDFGDTPFRIEEVVRVYDDAMSKVKKLQQGEWIDLPVGRERYVRVENTGTQLQLKEMTGARAKTMDVDLESPQLAKVLARTANVAQESVFFDYSRLGNYGKTLRGGPAAILSGIFSWFFKAADVPLFKRGLVTEMMSQPYQYRTNSPAIKAQQGSAAAQRAMRRGMMQTAANAMLGDERQLDALARAYGYNKTTASAIFDAAAGLMPAVALNPLNVLYRNIEPLLLTGPTQTVVGGLEALVDRAVYGDIYDKPEVLTQVLDVDLSKLSGDELLRAMMVQNHVRRVLRGEQFNPKQFMTIIGLSGGPLLGTLQKMQAAEAGGRPFTSKDGIAELARLTFGATPSAALDLAFATMGELGWDAAREWADYGKDQVKRGFSAGTAQSNMEGLTAYGIRQILGLGQLSQYAGLDAASSEATGKNRYGRLDMALDDAKKAFKRSLVDPAVKRAEQLYIVKSRDPSPENITAYNQAMDLAETTKRVVEREIRAYKDKLKDQFDQLKQRGK